MRLSQYEILTIKNLARSHFGKKAKVFLFGSRTDNSKKGGDIDLFIKRDQDIENTYLRKLKFSCDLELSLGLQKIDVVVDNFVDQHSYFYQKIQETAIEL